MLARGQFENWGTLVTAVLNYVRSTAQYVVRTCFPRTWYDIINTTFVRTKQQVVELGKGSSKPPLHVRHVAFAVGATRCDVMDGCMDRGNRARTGGRPQAGKLRRAALALMRVESATKSYCFPVGAISLSVRLRRVHASLSKPQTASLHCTAHL